MRQLPKYPQLQQIKTWVQRYWTPLIVGLITTIAVLNLWQQLLQEEVLLGKSSHLPTFVLGGSLIGTWTLVLMVYLGQRIEQQAQQAKRMNQQLQEEIIYRQQVEISLRASEERWQLAMRGNNDGIWDWDITMNEIVYSPRCKEMLGYTDQEHGNTAADRIDLVHPEDRDWVIQKVQDHLAQKTPFYSSEHRVRCKDGSYRWILDRGQAIWDGAGHALRMTGSHTDITERKQVEIMLRESEQKYRHLVNHLNAGFVVHAPDTQIVQCNAIACELLGLSMAQMLGKVAIDPAWHFVHHDGTAMAPEDYPVNQVISTGFPLENYIVGICHGSTVKVWVLVTAFPEWDGKGQLQQIVVTFIDISRLKQAELAVARLAAIVESSEDAIIGKSLAGMITSWNAGAEKIFGYSAAEMIGQSITQLLPDHAQNEEPEILAKIRRGERISNYDTQRLRKDGTLVDLSINVSPVRDSQGTLIGASHIARDIRDRKQIETELRQAKTAAEAANRAKSIFLANMSHELRTPLNVILGFAQVMAHDLTLTPSQQDNLKTIRHSGDHLLNLINDILDLSKIEAGRSTLTITKCDLSTLLYSLQTMMTEQAHAKQLQLKLTIAPEVPQFVMADEQKLRQILLNLLSNAIKFTHQGSVALQVCLAPTAAKADLRDAQEPSSTGTDAPISLQFTVTDTGVGIAANEQSHIFDAFGQAEAGKTTIGGTGLGLTISRKLLELMQGEISVQSRPLVGSTFTVIVPVCPTDGMDPQPAQSDDRQVIGLAPGQLPRRMLVVDDHQDNRTLLVQLLTHLGIETRDAASGHEALDIWQTWHPHLIFMDIQMPGMNGYETTQRIREEERRREETSPCIILALTAQVSHSDLTLALTAGCDDYISKPFQANKLFLKLRKYLGLEYRYEELDTSPNAVSEVNDYPVQGSVQSCDFTRLETLPTTWLQALEEASICGNNRAIAELVNQLPGDDALLGKHLIHLADQFQFEQILDLVQQYVSHSIVHLD